MKLNKNEYKKTTLIFILISTNLGIGLLFDIFANKTIILEINNTKKLFFKTNQHENYPHYTLCKHFLMIYERF